MSPQHPGQFGHPGHLERLGPVVRFTEIDSTNRYLADEARKGALPGLVCVAEHQTSGRGRLGRTWEAPPGANLLMSVLMDAESAPTPHQLTVSVALAAADACRKITGLDVGLKWPNDLVVDDVKLAGILAEVLAEQLGVVVGLGLNVNWPGPGAGAGTGAAAGATADQPGSFEATSLARAVGHPVDTELVLTEVLGHLDQRIADPVAPGSLMDEYRSRCVTIGRQVRVEEMSGTTTGLAAGITDEGHLIVQTDTDPAGGRIFTTGDVVHLRYDR
jgi:BirA family transcriptional regulator, biotin operon repressor / biotin---[acetyl-CoA-carboxylase] ligase